MRDMSATTLIYGDVWKGASDVKAATGFSEILSWNALIVTCGLAFGVDIMDGEYEPQSSKAEGGVECAVCGAY
jgi:hypothetical protein